METLTEKWKVKEIKRRNRISIHEDCLIIVFFILFGIAAFGLNEYITAKKFHTKIQKQLDEQKYFLERLERSLNGK